MQRLWASHRRISEPIPTPTVQDGKNDGGPSQFERNSLPLNAFVKGETFPTPRASDGPKPPMGTDPNKEGVSGYVKRWPTPKSAPSGPDFAREDRDESGGDDLATAVEKERRWRTPSAHEASGGPHKGDRHRPDATIQLRDQVGGQLNPDWVELLMGFPLGWTDLEAEVRWPTPTVVTDTGGVSMSKWGGAGARKQLRKVATPAEINGALNPAWVEALMGLPVGWTDLDAEISPQPAGLNAWEPGWEDGIPRVAKGIKDRVARLKALGNAVVPQCAEWVGLQIMEMEAERLDTPTQKGEESSPERGKQR